MSIFSHVKGFRPKKHAFNLEHSITQTQDIGELVPCYIHDDLLPGSTEKLSASTLCRFQALLSPLQHNVNLYTHFWYVPYRLLDAKFPKFISGEFMRDNLDYEPYVVVYRNLFDALSQNAIAFGDIGDDEVRSMFGHGSLLEYLGYPVFDEPNLVDFETIENLEFSLRRFQAFFLILVERYINENFKIEYKFYSRSASSSSSTEDFVEDARRFATSQSRTLIGVPSYVDVLAGLMLHFRRKYKSHFPPHAWFKDYYTSALPFTQLGSEVSISLAETAPVGGVVKGMPVFNTNGENNTLLAVDSGQNVVSSRAELGPLDGVEIDLTSPLQADLSAASAITINELRIANAIQSLKESFARFGTRYQEWLKGFWNVSPSDKSIQLPEWLGGFKTPINIVEVEQNSATDNTGVTGAFTPLGSLAGKGMGISSDYVYKHYIDEPGLILGLCFLQPKAVYPTNGVDRHLLKTNNLYDYFTNKLEHVGEQELYNFELYYALSPDREKQVFGYQSRYAEYKFIPSRFRGQFANLLDFWHLGRKFEDVPNLANDFLYIDKETMKRPFAVQDVDGVDISNCMLWFNFKVDYIAPMSRFGTPSLLN